MTVAELIAKLQEMPQAAEVTLKTDRPAWVRTVRSIRPTKGGDGEFGNYYTRARASAVPLVVLD